MKTLLMTMFLFFYMCIGEDVNGVDTHQTYWYVVNQTSEVLYLYGRGEDKLSLFKDEGRTEVYNVGEINSVRPYCDFYIIKTKPHDLYLELVLLSSEKEIIRKWSIRDYDINERHIMHPDAWNGKLYNKDEITIQEWSYNITDEDLDTWRGSDEGL